MQLSEQVYVWWQMRGSSSFTSGRNTERERSTREEKAEEEAKKAEEAAKAERDKSMSLQAGVAVGTMDPQDDEKVVYLTFDNRLQIRSVCLIFWIR